MPQYLVASYLPDDFDPSVISEEIVEAIYAVNRELIAAGARKFACGLSPASEAKTLRPQPNGKISVTDGPYIETKEHIGGLLILEAANLDEALAWARKGMVWNAVVEVREIQFHPDPKGATQ
ncbi:MAG: YciI family protein [Rhodothermales bacterium]|nr:YciI family protein [Rhodothermales bacterium]